MSLPRLLIAGTGGDSGKTLVALGLIKSLRHKEYQVAAFKKGPDYIDPAWLKLASGSDVRNLDTWMMGEEAIIRSFKKHAISDGINLIEGNRGLLDGEDAKGSHSSALIAKLLKTPVILVMPVVKVTRTAAAMVAGIQALEPELNLAGVIINRYAGPRHLRVIRDAIEYSTGVPVLGAIPKLTDNPLPGRHLGLITPEENADAVASIEFAGRIINDNVDVSKVIQIAKGADELEWDEELNQKEKKTPEVRIAYFSGSAFTFYYPENLEALEDAGAQLIAVDPKTDRKFPKCHALYIGGGFPETNLDRLSRNQALMVQIKEAVEKNLPVWAECGGLMYLSKGIWNAGRASPMAGIFDAAVQMHTKPQGHGYMEIVVSKENPFLTTGLKLRGHEFHYSAIEEMTDLKTVFEVKRGVGVGDSRDGYTYKNVVASYFHLHATSCPEWAIGMVNAARAYKKACQ
ncbi:cobyrinate a,c-diamide synthase [Calditrichota bacterium]